MNDEKDNGWERLSVKLPCKSKSYHVIYAFDHIVVVLYFDDKYKEIWCLELNTLKWFKSHLKIPMEIDPDDYVVTDDCYVHCFEYNDRSAYHIRMDLLDMIPPQLFDFYVNYFNIIIFGFVRLNMEKPFECHVSQDLKQLISKYYNALCQLA